TFAVPEEDLAGAVALHTHGDGGEGGGAQFGRAEGLAVAGAATFEEVLPQGLGGVALADAAADEARLAIGRLPGRRPVANVLRDLLELPIGDIAVAFAVGAGGVADARQPGANHVLDRVIIDHGGGDEELAALVVVGDDGGDVGHFAVVVFEEDTAGADD